MLPKAGMLKPPRMNSDHFRIHIVTLQVLVYFSSLKIEKVHEKSPKMRLISLLFFLKINLAGQKDGL